MTWSRRLLAPIVIAAGLSACGVRPGPDSEPVGAEPPPVASVAPAPEGVGTPTPTPAPPEALAALVRESSCDILPETGEIVGSLAHDRGYPRWTGQVIVFDSVSPHMTPDPLVVDALTAGTTYENEVHDCQRLVVERDGAVRFGPLVGILPLDPAMEFRDTDFVGGKAIATVYNWGDFGGNPEEYQPLAIGDGWNCLWLRRDRDSWRAAMTLDEPAPCLERPSPDSADYTLDVQRALHRDAMPKTARWGWNERHSVQLIGVKCGSAWCWIGPESLGMAESINLVGPPESTIPGYFDEQHLPVPGRNGITPGPIGVVTPTPAFHRLAQLQLQNPLLNIIGARMLFGISVARIDIPGLLGPTPEPYASRWGSQQRPVTLGLRMQGFPPGLRSTFRDVGNNPVRTVVPTTLHNQAHASVGAVRWRWHDTSRTVSIWSGCGVRGQDCCDTQ